jgi:cytochrome c2
MAMPGFALSEDEIDDLVAFLTKGREERVPTTRPSTDSERVQEGKLLFESYGCTACHRVGSEKFARVPAYYDAERQAAIARQSPDLQYASRLNRTWAIDFMEKPGRYIPGTTMFNNGAGRSSLEKILDYLSSVAPSSAGTVAKRDSR